MVLCRDLDSVLTPIKSQHRWTDSTKSASDLRPLKDWGIQGCQVMSFPIGRVSIEIISQQKAVAQKNEAKSISRLRNLWSNFLKDWLTYRFHWSQQNPRILHGKGQRERRSVPAEKPVTEHGYGCERELRKSKCLSERTSQRRKHFSFSRKSFRKLLVFQMKTFSLNSKQLFFSQLLFTEEGSVSALSFSILPPQNVNQALCLGLGSYFSEKKEVLWGFAEQL